MIYHYCGDTRNLLFDVKECEFYRLLKMVEESFGKSAKGNVDEIQADHLPCILIVYKMKGGVDIRNIIQGKRCACMYR